MKQVDWLAAFLTGMVVLAFTGLFYIFNEPRIKSPVYSTSPMNGIELPVYSTSPMIGIETISFHHGSVTATYLMDYYTCHTHDDHVFCEYDE